MFVENDGPSNSSGDSVCNNEVSKDCVGHYVNNCCKTLKKRIVEDAWDALTESQNGGSETEGLIMSNEYLSREIVTLKKDYKKQKDSLDTATNDLATAANAMNELVKSINADKEAREATKNAQKDLLRRLLESYEN